MIFLLFGRNLCTAKIAKKYTHCPKMKTTETVNKES